jgi:hypothetical protein
MSPRSNQMPSPCRNQHPPPHPHHFLPMDNFLEESSSHDSPLNNQVRIFVKENYRYIMANGLPDHEIGKQPNHKRLNRIRPQNYFFRVPITPEIADQILEVRRRPFGVAVNGVVFDPESAEFWNGDRHSGWQYEVMAGESKFRLDVNHAHIRSNGTYHYHGLPVGLINQLSKVEEMLLIGYAADGFPIYNQYTYSDPANPERKVQKLRSSYQLKGEERPDGPGDQYDGTFVQDYKYILGSGDLDECNGCFGVTPEYPDGIYHYHVTQDFPYIPRYFRGLPDSSFFYRKNHPGP